MKSFAFDIGNSTSGPLGAVLRVQAETEEQAVVLANIALETIFNRGEGASLETVHSLGVEYCNVYLGFVTLTADDIRDSEDIDQSEVI